MLYMWDDSNFDMEFALDNLVSMSMVKIVDGKKLWMHDQFQALGREIICVENFRDLGQRSRLWMHEGEVKCIKLLLY